MTGEPRSVDQAQAVSQFRRAKEKLLAAPILSLIVNNWRWSIGCILVGISVANWALPYLSLKNLINWRLSETSIQTLLFLWVVFTFLLAVSYVPALRFWTRYKNNYNLSPVPLTFVDGLLLILIPSILVLLVGTTPAVSLIAPSFSSRVWLLALGVSLSGWLLLIWLKARKSVPRIDPRTKPSFERDYFPDEPIVLEKDDLLDRGQFVEDLYKQICNYSFPESFVFSLQGKWGEGKTSVLNLLKNKLQQDPNAIVFPFDPWYFSSPEDLVKSFYQGLYLSLNKIFFLPNYRKLFVRYQKFLSAGLKLKGIAVDLPWQDVSLETLKKNIEELIARTGRKIIVVVEDIDRLQEKKDVHEIFKLVKLSGNFKNTIFVLSFDQSTIKSLLRQEIATDPLYLEKCVQAQINLPQIDQAHIDRFLYFSYPEEKYTSAIDLLLSKCRVEESLVKEFEKDFTPLYQMQIKRLFPTLRRAKRYLNRLYRTYPSVQKEVQLFDFMILELIAEVCPELYEDIWAKPWYYIPPWGMQGFTFPYELTLKKEEKYQKIKAHISDLLSNHKEREILTELLQEIFFVEVKNAFSGMETGHDSLGSVYRSKKRITHPDVFPKYFMLKVPRREIPDEIVEGLIGQWNGLDAEDLNAKVTDDLERFKKSGKLLTLLQRLTIFRSDISQRTAKSVITFIYRNISFFSQEGDRFFFQTEFDQAEALLLRLVDSTIEPNAMQSVLAEAITNSPSFELAVTIVQILRKKGDQLHRLYDNISFGELHRIFATRCERYFVDGKRDIFFEEKWIHSILREWFTLDSRTARRASNYVISLIDSNPRYLGTLIRAFSTNWGKDRGYEVQYKELAELFDLKMIYAKAKSNYGNSFSTAEEQQALDAFLRVHEGLQKDALRITSEQKSESRFIQANRRGFELFEKGMFLEAHQAYDEALSTGEWNDEHNWRPNAKLRNWQCLLELAFNQGNEPQRKYYDQAYIIAGSEAEIRNLVRAAFNQGAPDQVPVHAMFCLFYYLQWHFSPEEEKEQVKEQFLKHYDLTTGKTNSGWTQQIRDRCESLMTKMISH